MSDVLRGVNRVGAVRAPTRRFGVVGNDKEEDLAVDNVQSVSDSRKLVRQGVLERKSLEAITGRRKDRTQAGHDQWAPRT